MRESSPLIRISALAVNLAAAINRLFLLGVIAGLASSWLFAERLASWLIGSGPQVDAKATLVGIRCELAIGLVMAVALDRLLHALGQVIASTRGGDPFHADNARRLQTVGWALLVLQLLDIPALLLGRLFPGLGSAAPDGGISLGGWSAVLLVFVLARVFAAGSVMRADLDGTI